MIRLSSSSLVAAAIVVASTLAFVLSPGGRAAAHGVKFSAGQPGDPNKPARTVEIVMLEEYGLQLFKPERIEVKHAAEMAKHPNMKHAEPNGVSVGPTKTDEIVWKFTKPGTFEYACLIPGHREDGMLGHVVVQYD